MEGGGPPPRMAMAQKGMPERPGGPAAMNPGDQAPPGTPGTGEAVCPDCKGSGRVGGARCETCGGTGKVTQGIGGG